MWFSKKFLFFFIFLSSFGVSLAYTPPTTPYSVNDVFFSFAYGNMWGLIPSLTVVGLVTFLSGVVKYIGAGDNEEKRGAGRSVMIYGIIVLLVMMSMWSFVNILTQSFFGVDSEIPDYLPKPI